MSEQTKRILMMSVIGLSVTLLLLGFIVGMVDKAKEKKSEDQIVEETPSSEEEKIWQYTSMDESGNRNTRKSETEPNELKGEKADASPEKNYLKVPNDAPKNPIQVDMFPQKSLEETKALAHEFVTPVLASPGLLLLLSFLSLFIFFGVMIVFTEEDDERWNFAGGAVCRPDGEISEELFFSQFNNAGKFTDKGQIFMAVAEKYGVDPVLMAAVAFHETGSGTSAAVMLKNNPGGLMDPATGSRFLYAFTSIEEGIEAMGKTLHNRIIKDGLITISDLGSAYAPIGADNDPTGLNNHWVFAVTKFVAQFGGLTMNCEVHVVGDWMIPLTTGIRITSPFGWRIHPVYEDVRLHTGVDLACTNGDPILAAQSGNVIYASGNGWSNGYGLHVMINHGEVTTLYAHLNSTKVKINDVVTQGDVIGTCGSTGTSTGNHLHFEIIRAGAKEDPMPYLTEYKPVGDE